MPGFLLLAPLLDLERDVFAAVLRPVSGCVAAVSRAGAAAKFGGSSCHHGAHELRLRVPLAVLATAVSVWCACDCVTDAS